MKLQNLLIGILFGTGILLGPSVAFAKLDLVSITTNPQTPGPNEDVTVSVQSYVTNLNAAKIIWYVDKEPIKEGIGEKTFQTRTKSIGQSVVIEVVIIGTNGEQYNKKLVLTPIEVDMLWEADTYVPPFYKGKALPTYKSIVKVTAIPRFNSLTSDPANYYYKWTVNRTQGVGEGLGHNSAPIGVGWPNSSIPVTVDVSLAASGGSGSATTFLPITDPTILFYEQAPLLGALFAHALKGSVTAEGNEYKIRAVPYFFSNDDLNGGQIVYSWRKNAQPVASESNPDLFTLGKDSKAAQATTISLFAQNRKRVLQQANEHVIVNFLEEN